MLVGSTAIIKNDCLMKYVFLMSDLYLFEIGMSQT